MGGIVRKENRVCPHCGHRYVRNVYRQCKKNSDLSICPKCHRRNDSGHGYVSRWKSPIKRSCKRCGNIFFTKSRTLYCEACRDIVRREQNKINAKKWRKRQKKKGG